MRTVFFGNSLLQVEVYDWNKQFGEIMPRTAGIALYGKTGLEVSYNKFSLGSEVILSVNTNLAG